MKITGMSCEACVSHVKKALEAVTGVVIAAVNLEKQEAMVEHSGTDSSKLVLAVEEEGYGAQIAA